MRLTVWIVGHVLTGWDGSNPLVNPTNLFYQMYVPFSKAFAAHFACSVDRFSPHVIASSLIQKLARTGRSSSHTDIFFGHTHEDQFTIFYANNATKQHAKTAQSVAWVCFSRSPVEWRCS